jgi:hypothetical protein
MFFGNLDALGIPIPYLLYPHDGVDDRMAMLSKAATCRSQVVYDHTR